MYFQSAISDIGNKTIGRNNCLFTTMAVRKERKSRRQYMDRQPDRNTGRSLRLSPICLGASSQAIKRYLEEDIEQDIPVIHTERVLHDSEKPRISRYVQRQKLKMSSFTIDIDNLVTDSLNLSTTGFKIQSLRQDVKEEKFRSKESHIRARILSTIKVMTDKSKQVQPIKNQRKSLDFKVSKLASKMIIHDRFEGWMKMKLMHKSGNKKDKQSQKERDKNINNDRLINEIKGKKRMSEFIKKVNWGDIKPWDHMEPQIG